MRWMRRAVFVLLLAGATTQGSAAPESLPSNEASPYVRHLAQLINAYRSHNGLGPLELAPDLNAIAYEHSLEMVKDHRLSHNGFRARFDQTRARICVENVGVNYPYPEAQLEGWRASRGHDRNLLEPKVARMGVAISQSFVTFFACS